MKNAYATVLTIAGSDSSGGAGIQADIKTISATGCYAASVITALTAQNTLGVQSIQAIPHAFVEQQLESVFQDLKISAVKIGMLQNANIIATVASALAKFKPKYVVLDPVMVSKNNCELLDSQVIHTLKKELIPAATLITPNVYETEKLCGIKIIGKAEQELAAVTIGREFNISVLVKGGHMEGKQASDIVYVRETDDCHWFHANRINTQNTHGTGCSLSSAIASYLAQAYSLKDAIFAAKQYLTKAIQYGAALKIGQGYGPVDHFFVLRSSS